jgi:UDP-N-acetylglucosamine acyltransferase
MTTTELIHPSAVVDPHAQLGSGVRIGPFCVVGADVVLGDGVELKSHVVVTGRTRIGAGSTVFPFASLGHQPQDLKFRGEPSELVIGARCMIRENVTMNPGTEGGGMVTRVGDGGLFMVGVHVAHDCQVGNNVILANAATLAGHVVIEDQVIIGGLSAVKQFVRIGAHAMIGGMSGVEADVVPYGLVKGERAWLDGLNYVGLQRRGFGKEAVHALRALWRDLFEGPGTMAERLVVANERYAGAPEAMRVIDFIKSRDARPLCTPRG